jgi:hypothetical protein
MKYGEVNGEIAVSALRPPRNDGVRAAVEEIFMKKAKSDPLRPEYVREDFGKGVRGKYYEAYRKGTNVVLLSPDVAKVFPTDDSVNEALRSLILLAEKTARPSKRSAGGARGRASGIRLPDSGSEN